MGRRGNDSRRALAGSAPRPARPAGADDGRRGAVRRGPRAGSFTGLRVGIATVQGLALAHGRPVVGMPVLDVLVDIAAQAAGAGAVPDLIAPWVDARRGEVFSALYEPAPGPPSPLGPGDAEAAAGAGWRVTEARSRPSPARCWTAGPIDCAAARRGSSGTASRPAARSSMRGWAPVRGSSTRYRRWRGRWPPWRRWRRGTTGRERRMPFGPSTCAPRRELARDRRRQESTPGSLRRRTVRTPGRVVGAKRSRRRRFGGRGERGLKGPPSPIQASGLCVTFFHRT